MRQVNMHEAKTHLSRLVDQAAAGEPFVICKARRPDFNVQPAVLRRALLDGGWQELAIAAHLVLAVANLPPLHRDPFDRLLLAQASADGLMLITSDRQLGGYPGPIRLMDAKDKQGVEAFADL